MYAVLKTGGKQYRVSPGQTIKVEKLDQGEGETVTFEDILLVVDGTQVQIGAPYLNIKVMAEVVSHGLGEKIRVLKFKRRKNYLRTQGHRQSYTAVKITDIQNG